jgi:hypothetical protein
MDKPPVRKRDKGSHDREHLQNLWLSLEADCLWPVIGRSRDWNIWIRFFAGDVSKCWHLGRVSECGPFHFTPNARCRRLARWCIRRIAATAVAVGGIAVSRPSGA